VLSSLPSLFSVSAPFSRLGFFSFGYFDADGNIAVVVAQDVVINAQVEDAVLGRLHVYAFADDEAEPVYADAPDECPSCSLPYGVEAGRGKDRVPAGPMKLVGRVKPFPLRFDPDAVSLVDAYTGTLPIAIGVDPFGEQFFMVAGDGQGPLSCLRQHNKDSDCTCQEQYFSHALLLRRGPQFKDRLGAGTQDPLAVLLQFDGNEVVDILFCERAFALQFAEDGADGKLLGLGR